MLKIRTKQTRNKHKHEQRSGGGREGRTKQAVTEQVNYSTSSSDEGEFVDAFEQSSSGGQAGGSSQADAMDRIMKLCPKTIDLSDIECIFLDQQDSLPTAITGPSDFIQYKALLVGLRARGEYSARGLWVSQQLIMLNKSDYSAWQYRLQCIQTGNLISDNECLLRAGNTWRQCGASLGDFQFSYRILDISHKNYQLWNHRRQIFNLLPKSDIPHQIGQELTFCDYALEIDVKNVHAWGYRLAVVHAAVTCKDSTQHSHGHENIVEGELQYVDSIINCDQRNNSAWCYRGQLLQMLINNNPDQTKKYLGDELMYASRLVGGHPFNQATWAYIRGLFTINNVQYDESLLEKALEIALEVCESEPVWPCHEARFTVAYLLDKYQELQNGAQHT